MFSLMKSFIKGYKEPDVNIRRRLLVYMLFFMFFMIACATLLFIISGALVFSGNANRFALAFLALILLGVAASMVLTKIFAKTICEKLSVPVEEKMPEKLSDEETDQQFGKIGELRPQGSPIPEDLFEDFIARVKTLTPTETGVFRLHAEGKSSSEITAAMFFTINTLKMHNRHIYEKLGISSRDELTLYVELIKKSGQGWKILHRE